MNVMVIEAEGWRRGQKLQALQADRNFWAPQE